MLPSVLRSPAPESWISGALRRVFEKRMTRSGPRARLVSITGRPPVMLRKKALSSRRTHALAVPVSIEPRGAPGTERQGGGQGKGGAVRGDHGGGRNV